MEKLLLMDVTNTAVGIPDALAIVFYLPYVLDVADFYQSLQTQ